MKQEIIQLYDEYTHKPLKREEFIPRLATLAGSTAAAMTRTLQDIMKRWPN